MSYDVRNEYYVINCCVILFHPAYGTLQRSEHLSFWNFEMGKFEILLLIFFQQYKGVTQQKHYSSNAARYIKRKNKNISGMIFLA